MLLQGVRAGRRGKADLRCHTALWMCALERQRLASTSDGLPRDMLEFTDSVGTSPLLKRNMCRLQICLHGVLNYGAKTERLGDVGHFGSHLPDVRPLQTVSVPEPAGNKNIRNEMRPRTPPRHPFRATKTPPSPPAARLRHLVPGLAWDICWYSWHERKGNM